MSALFLDDVTRSIVEIAHADAARLTQPAYNLHGYTVRANDIAEKLRQRYQTFDCKYESEERLVNLISSWPSALVTDAASKDWDWTPEFDFEKTANAMFTLFERN